MSSKKKLVISLSVAAAVLVAAIIAIVAVFAATQQTVSSFITVRYTADPTISGSARASYSYGTTVVNKPMTVNGESTGSQTVVFDADDEQDQKGKLQPQEEIALTGKIREVTFQYFFTNTGRDAYTATVSFAPDNAQTENVKYFYYSETEEDWVEITSDTTEAELTITVAADAVDTSLQVKVKVDNVAKDASFIGSINWDLNRVAPTQG